jgi:hypothetical protein
MDEYGVASTLIAAGVMSLFALNGYRLQRKEESLRERAESEADVVDFGKAVLNGLSNADKGNLSQQYLGQFANNYGRKVIPLWKDLETHQQTIADKNKTISPEFIYSASRYRAAARGLDYFIKRFSPTLSIL